MAVEAVPENPADGAKPTALPKGMLEARMEETLAKLTADATAPNTVLRQGHLALLKRWYYRPEVKREGEIFFPDAEGQWPIKALLRGVGRVAAHALETSPAK